MAKQEGTPTVDKIVEELQRLQLAHELLDKVFLAIGPYPDLEIQKKLNQIDGKLWSKVKDYFNFDDSE